MCEPAQLRRRISSVTRRTRNGPARALVAVTTCVLAAVLFVACGGTTNPGGPPRTAGSTASTPSTAAPAALPDVAPTAADFVNINTMTRVGDHFVGSLNGHLAAALAVARSPKGGVYPVGTVVQLIPTEAMVKRHKGYSPSTGRLGVLLAERLGRRARRSRAREPR